MTWDTTDADNMSFMFRNCQSLSNLDLTKFSTNNVTTFEGMFNGCTGLKTITIGEYFVINNGAKTLNMFGNTTNLQALIIGKERDDSDVFVGILGPDQWIYYPSIGVVSNTKNPYYKDAVGVHLVYKANWNYEPANSTTGLIDIAKIIDAGYLNNCTNAFDGQDDLTAIANITNLETSRVGLMTRMFQNCRAIESLNLSNFVTSNVTDMTSMFKNCAKLSNLSIKNDFITSSTTGVVSMFEGCATLASLDLSNCNTSSIITMDSMFKGCKLLNSNFKISSNFIGSSVQSTTNMFNGCTGLESLDLHGSNVSGVGDMSYMFQSCSALTNLNVGWSGMSTRTTTLNSMFNACANLSTLDLSTFNTPNVTNFEQMFVGCTKLNNLILPSNFIGPNATNLIGMFGYCTAITTVALDSSGPQTFNNTLNMSSMFYGCSNLKTMSLSNWNATSVNGENLFRDCANLESAYLNGIDFNDLTEMFSGCAKLRYINISSADFVNASNKTNTFLGCTSLQAINASPDSTLNANAIIGLIPRGTANDWGYIESEGLIYYKPDPYWKPNESGQTLRLWPPYYEVKNNIATIQISKILNDGTLTSCYESFKGQSITSLINVNYLDTTHVTTFESMFSGCTQITSINISGFTTTGSPNMNNMFNGCTQLRSITFDKGFTITSGTTGMFTGCTNLESVTIGAGRTDSGDFTDLLGLGWVYDETTGVITFDSGSIEKLNFDSRFFTINNGVVTISKDVIDKTGIITTCNNSFTDNDFNAASVTVINNINTQLDTSKVTSFSGMFSGCTNLTTFATTT